MPELPFLDSFDHYNNATAGDKWTNYSTSSITNVVARHGGQSLAVSPFGPTKSLISQPANLYVGAAINATFYASGMFQLSNSLTTAASHTGGIVALVNIIDVGRFQLEFDGPGGTHYVTAIAGPSATNVWYYYEMGVLLTATTVELIFRINNLKVIDETYVFSNGSDGYQLTSNVGWNTISLHGPAGGSSYYFDDFYAGSTGFFGDVTVQAVYPTGAGAVTAWTPSTGANWQNAATTPPNPVVNYNSSSAAAQEDLYAISPALPGTITIQAVQSLVYAEKSDAGPATYQAALKSGATTVNGSTQAPSSGAFLWGREGYAQSPFTLAAWTVVEVNALQIGQTRVT